MSEAESYRAAIDLARAHNAHERDITRLSERIVELEGNIRTMREIGGCRCDPVGSGEEWCVGACYLRDALSYIVTYADSGPIVRNIAMKALTRDGAQSITKVMEEEHVEVTSTWWDETKAYVSKSCLKCGPPWPCEIVKGRS